MGRNRPALFRGRHFEAEIIVLCVRWYLRFGLSLRNLPVRYLNNIVEQDHRAIKRRVRAMQGFRSFHSARRTIQGIETVNMIRKGQIRWLAKDDIAGQVAFISSLFSLALAA